MISQAYQSQKEEEFLFKTHPRISHLRKLYLTLFLQWTLCMVFSNLAINLDDLKDFLLETPLIGIISLIFLVIILMMSFFFRAIAGQFPLNLLLYLFFDVSLAFLFAYGCIADDSNSCFMFLMGMWAVSLSLFIYVLTTKCEITYQGATLFIVAAIFLVLEWFLFYTTTSLSSIFVVSFGIVIAGFYLVYDTQTMVSGVKYDWNKDDYFSGAVGVYMDVLLLGLRLCELVMNLIIRDRN